MNVFMFSHCFDRAGVLFTTGKIPCMGCGLNCNVHSFGAGYIDLQCFTANDNALTTR